MTSERKGLALTITDFDEGEPDRSGYIPLAIRTTLGTVRARFYGVHGATQAVILIGGAGGGFDSPAGELYPELAQRFVQSGLAALRLRYRLANEIDQSTLDVLAGMAYLDSVGIRQLALVGHSFGGAVAINAAALAPATCAVVTLATQSFGTDRVGLLAPRPILFLHGTEDEVLPPESSRQVYDRAGEPKELMLLPGVRHGLDEARDQLLDLLTEWIPAQLSRGEQAT